MMEVLMKNRFAVPALFLCTAILACDDDGGTGTSLSPQDFGANLTGAAVRPVPVITSATGTASIRVTTGTSGVYDPNDIGLANFTYSITVIGLSGPAIEACIHGPAGVNAVSEELATLTITSQQTNGLISSGTFTGTKNPQVSGDSLLVLLMTGNAYVDVHTAANLDGEIRGQALLLNGFRVAPLIAR
jgi:CHRD domain